MSDLLSDLKKHYDLLLKERAVIDSNLLKLKELIDLNEGRGREKEKTSSQLTIKNREDNTPISPSILPNREDSKRISQSILQNREDSKEPSQTTAKPAAASTGAPQYDTNMNWQQKIAIAMRLIGKPATAREIAVKIKELEPDSTLSIDKSVELTTSRMYKSGEIAARKEGVKNYYSL
jgi:hypothetical protein